MRIIAAPAWRSQRCREHRRRGPPVARRKHLQDVRGIFATRLMTTTDLGNEEIASIMGWSPAEVERIRRIYVDDAARNVALGRRIARGV